MPISKDDVNDMLAKLGESLKQLPENPPDAPPRPAAEGAAEPVNDDKQRAEIQRQMEEAQARVAEAKRKQQAAAERTARA
ncbi:MAG TPA: hypothetical protein VM686_33325, partial [Polyangiaceae bacterium]|nr:hypothetical protein [Polyangiaceae bacterium]